ncbi:MAG: DUF2334 domain-containing protein [Bacteroidetes bacterium]|nr:DUF2334 domain-containing protein [Bacteroidota bacterium]
MKRLVIIHLALLLLSTVLVAQNYPLKKVLIIAENKPDLNSEASGVTRDLAQLLGHFNTQITFESSGSYKADEINQFHVLFYVGLSPENHPAEVLIRDILRSSIPVVWLNTGMSELLKTAENQDKYGFNIIKYLENSEFDSVKTNSYSYTKGRSEINLIQINKIKEVKTYAYAFSSRTNKLTPYMLQSGNLWYIADIPFLGAKVTDRYLLFADKLHDILNERHPVSHTAILRIEDVTPLHDPVKLRQVADFLSDRGIPFLVAVIPIYINPQKNEQVNLSDRPEVVNALEYMVANGGSIVMHGSTHQNTGVSANDAEFWDAVNAKPLPDENPEEYAKKIESGLNEFVKCKLYPIAWETPHYMASPTFFNVVSKYFSTSVEQRMSISNFDYGQYFPFLINRDLYGQKIFPENLGYVPLKDDIRDSRAAVGKLIKNAEAIYQVRDGIAGCFFHPFLDIELLKTLVDGITAQGYTFLNLRKENNWVKTRDFVILTGSQTYTMNPGNSYLYEQFTDQNNQVTRKSVSKNRIKTDVSKRIDLRPGELYFAQAVDYKIKEVSFKDKVIHKSKSLYRSLFENDDWQPARIKVVWNPDATGAAWFDQSSFISVFRNLNMLVDTLVLNTAMDLTHCNLLVVPFSSADLLSNESKKQVRKYVEEGGNLVSDCRNGLINEFGITFSDSKMNLHYIRDKYYPKESITWQKNQMVNVLDYNTDDEIFCEDATSGLPVAIGRDFQDGRIIYLNSAFDPLTSKGYSYYPFFMEYVQRYFNLHPIIKNQNLEFYFDPGFRNNSNPEELVQQWVKQGIRRIHVAGWHQYLNYTYDYERLINLAHSNGILVYAWLEPPQVSKKFWDNHPEWREKNYLGQDIHKDEELKASWRYPVALTDKKCFNAAMAEYLGMLEKFDFDGVNIAELCFDAGQGFNDPQLFTPMHPSAADQFKRIYGYNLKDIFNSASAFYWKSNEKVREQVIAFRVDKIMELHHEFLSEMSSFAKTRGDFDIVVTFYDTYLSPELTEYTGVNSDKIIELRKKYKFHLQPEDPLNKWSTDPDRYIEMGKIYAGKMADPSDLMLDLNIFKFRDKDQVSPFSTLIQTGLESYQLIAAASVWAQRVAIYSESSCNSQDIPYFSYASSGMVQYKFLEDGLQVSSPRSFVLQLPKSIKVIHVDGADALGHRDNQFLIPAGNHSIITDLNEIPGFSNNSLHPQLLSFSGNLLKVECFLQMILFKYDSEERAFASLNYMPTMVRVDNKIYPAKILKGDDCFTIMLPSGKHTVEIVTGGKFSYGINMASIWSMSAISIYGIVASVLLFYFFIALKFIRKRYKS